MHCVIPKQNAVREMLAMLFGADLKVGEAEVADYDGSYAGMYVNPDGATVAACLADLASAAYMSAALSMVHPEVAKEATAAGSLSEMMVGNLYEVMNILTRLVMDDSTPHLKLEKVVSVAGDDGFAALLEASTRIDFSVSVPKYGDGVLSFLVT